MNHIVCWLILIVVGGACDLAAAQDVDPAPTAAPTDVQPPPAPHEARATPPDLGATPTGLPGETFDSGGMPPPTYRPGLSPFEIIPLVVLFLIWCVPPGVVCYHLAAAKGYSRGAWTICGLVPVLGFYSMYYLVGAPDRHLAVRLDRMQELLAQRNASDTNQQE